MRAYFESSGQFYVSLSPNSWQRRGPRGRGGRGARAGGGGPGAARRDAGGVTMGLVELLGDINEDGLRAAG